MDKLELAKWLHDNYEEIAKKENWNTQEDCKVEFNTLPDANKRTMIEMAEKLLNFDLLRLHFVSNSGLPSDDYDLDITKCPKCNSTDLNFANTPYQCNDCKHKWTP